MKTVLEEKMKLLEKAMEQLILNIQSNNSDNHVIVKVIILVQISTQHKISKKKISL